MHSLYANKETRDRLAGKSFVVYGTFTKWKKMAELKVLSVEQIEEVMDRAIIKAEEMELELKESEIDSSNE